MSTSMRATGWPWWTTLLLCFLNGVQGNTKALKLLDEHLRNYDRRSTPTNSQDRATNVSLELYVASLGSINTENMDYVADTYLRQKWWDPRLAHQELRAPLDLADPNLVKAIWKPEVFFPNAKEADFQFVTVPNVLIRIHPDGQILYILRLRLKFTCMMELSNYPLDRQICGMQIASFSKTTRELQLFWSHSHAPVSIATDLQMPQFSIEKVEATTCNEQFHLGNYSCLVAQFHMKRSVSFHLIQSYLPSILIVAVSWVSFWMDIESVPGRISLGVITLLAVSSQAGLDKNVPQTSYVKAIDIWMGLCTAFVFAALVEFTIVNVWFRKNAARGGAVAGRHHRLGHQRRRRRDLVLVQQAASTVHQHSSSPQRVDEGLSPSHCRLSTSYMSKKTASPVNDEDELMVEETHPTLPGASGNTAMATPTHPAEMVDRACRGLFPLGFLICNILYWLYFLRAQQQTLEKSQ